VTSLQSVILQVRSEILYEQVISKVPIRELELDLFSSVTEPLIHSEEVQTPSRRLNLILDHISQNAKMLYHILELEPGIFVGFIHCGKEENVDVNMTSSTYIPGYPCIPISFAFSLRAYPDKFKARTSRTSARTAFRYFNIDTGAVCLSPMAKLSRRG
jgi:hypothetical protein